MFIHKKTVIFIPYFDSPFCLINYWQNGGFFLKSEIPVDISPLLYALHQPIISMEIDDDIKVVIFFSQTYMLSVRENKFTT